MLRKAGNPFNMILRVVFGIDQIAKGCKWNWVQKTLLITNFYVFPPENEMGEKNVGKEVAHDCESPLWIPTRLYVRKVSYTLIHKTTNTFALPWCIRPIYSSMVQRTKKKDVIRYTSMAFT